MTTLRVRQLLSSLNSVELTALKKLLPTKVLRAPPDEPEGTRYPAALLAQLKAAAPTEEYALLGHVTEALLRAPVVSMETLAAAVATFCPAITPAHLAKIAASKTTEPYFAHIRATQAKLGVALESLEYDCVVSAITPTGVTLEGHPDAMTATTVFEVKTTGPGQVRKNWPGFLFQVFAYAALAGPEITEAVLVLPLQETVWRHGVTAAAWPNRAAFREALLAAASKRDAANPHSAEAAAIQLLVTHGVGAHGPKAKTLVATMAALDPRVPHQLFLAPPQCTKMVLDDGDIAAAAAIITERGLRVWIHSAYIINLCMIPGSKDDYHTVLLCRTLDAARALGARGVVVHVGKSTTQDATEALGHMRTNLMAAMEHATPECPILLETPAGQGTELLTNFADFAAFVVSTIHDPRLRACIDTCHVFATGTADPVTYLEQFHEVDATATKLVHLNDSATPCGSCVDRHAFVGRGEIGLDRLRAVVTTASAWGIPMVTE